MAITINVNLDEILAALKDDLDFTGNADKYIKVNATADGFEFAAVSGGGGTWGSITGTLSDQTDLQSALDAKYDASNPSGYITGIAWGAITGTLSSQTDLQSALDAKAALAGAAFTGDVSVTTSGSGDTLQLTNSGSGTTLNLLNSGSGDFLTIDSTKLVIDNGGDVSIGTATASARFHVLTGSTSKVGAIIQAAAGQTANLQEWKDSAGNVLASVSGGGNLAAELITFNNDDNQTNNTLPMLVGYYSNSSISINTPVEIFQYGVKGVNNYNPYGYLYLNKYGDVSIIEGDKNSTTRLVFNRTGNKIYTESLFGINSSSPSAMLDIVINSTSRVGLEINAAAGQTANLLEVKNSGGTNLFHITASGGIATNGNAGFTGTGSYTNFTIENGIITAAS